MQIKARVDTTNLDGIQKRMGDMRPYYDAGTEILIGSIIKTFDDQGRPQRWKPLAASTLLSGAGYSGQRFTRGGSASKGFERHLRGKQILVTSGRLRNSITKEATARHGTVGTNLVYAAVHNFGGQAGRGLKVFIPARPFIVAQAEDKAELRDLLRRWVMVGK